MRSESRFGYPWTVWTSAQVRLGVLPRLFVFLGTMTAMHMYGCGSAGNLHYVKGVAMFFCRREDCSVESDGLNHKVDFFSRQQEAIS